MRLALVGAGRHGSRYLLPENGLVGAGGWPTRIERVCANAIDTEELLREPTVVDAVIIATRPESHAEHAIRCLRAGLHVLVEKPAALKFEDVQAMTDTADREKRTLMVAHTKLFECAGCVGFNRFDVSDLRVRVGGARPARDMQSIPALVDWGCHAVAIALAHCWPRKLSVVPVDGDTWRVSRAGGYLLSMSGEGAHVTIDCGDFRERAAEFPGRESYTRKTAITRMVEVFSDACSRPGDFRASSEFTRAVYRVVLA